MYTKRHFGARSVPSMLVPRSFDSNLVKRIGKVKKLRAPSCVFLAGAEGVRSGDSHWRVAMLSRRLRWPLPNTARRRSSTPFRTASSPPHSSPTPCLAAASSCRGTARAVGATTCSSNDFGAAYEEVYLKAYDSVSNARGSIANYVTWYNERRPYSSLETRSRIRHTSPRCEQSKRQPDCTSASTYKLRLFVRTSETTSVAFRLLRGRTVRRPRKLSLNAGRKC
ncbi:Putative transposase (plasmid) [Cupriavidus necator]|uniref:Putative transposase n=1 Tax=Cupriavidus necator (strain ATCC 17699 / DSM 428 / KCTC 22496 / NCIMB 10442 / H16 / Stanier 337) TaxID=381666 RepID=Q7WXL2_CUPNH|nr:putative transposase [Cupriavidus necator H16]